MPPTKIFGWLFLIIGILIITYSLFGGAQISGLGIKLIKQ